MALFTTETLTIIAVVAIGTILSIYLTILKRNGWLDRNKKLYRCPNQQCRKIFEKPAELKDLSEQPARVYPACPKCGADIESHFSSSTIKKTLARVKPTLAQSNQKIAIIENKGEKKTIPEPTRVLTNVQALIKGDQTLKAETRTGNKSTPPTNAQGCQHYFGYLANREKQERIPDECLECPKSLDCMLADIKPKVSVQEMKKWYHSKT